MSVITRRLSVPELSQRVLEMAKTGVYRESVFEALQPLATQKQIREAIAHAKKFGLHSIASLRDAELGTYYQLDLVKYNSLSHTVHLPVTQGRSEDLVQQVMDASLVIRMMLTAAKGLATLLTILGMIFVFSGQQSIGLGLLISALTTAGLWSVQKVLTRGIGSNGSV